MCIKRHPQRSKLDRPNFSHFLTPYKIYGTQIWVKCMKSTYSQKTNVQHTICSSSCCQNEKNRTSVKHRANAWCWRAALPQQRMFDAQTIYCHKASRWCKIELYCTKYTATEQFKHFPLKSSYQSAVDKKLFRQITSNRHCLHSLLPRLRHIKALNSLRSRTDTTISYHKFNPIISFLNRCLFFFIRLN